MKLRLASLALLVGLLGASVLVPFAGSAQTQTTADDSVSAEAIKVSRSPVFDGDRRVGTFTGDLKAVKFDVRNGKLLVSGKLEGTLERDGRPDRDIDQKFENVVSTARANDSCRILTLDVGRIRLDLLGLVVDLSPIELDVTALRGEGRLLGNLLCALVGLLDR